MRSRHLFLLFAAALLGLAGCDQLGIEDPAKIQAAKEAEGKAVGSACRHAMRAIEDCYTLNPKAHKASVFAGWREMDEYMRENKLEGVVPVVPRPEPRKPANANADEADGHGADKPADKPADKAASKEEGKPAAKPKH
ncbi:hypothetical protein HNP55_004105 [Paucibacter oligotrophus]|uniref:Conjugative transfer region protein TrbK n=1 Tax=Roseateles oligotrophus TaxID=1769250 RepID=A0A840LG01_9BURK|nr:hypothetical protein [Roseateles oligotrophus]MBB4845553.1 hypothetical protein [Roseateles oligotrophus]